MKNQIKSAFITLTRLPYIKIADPDFDLKNSLWAFPIVGAGLWFVSFLSIHLLNYAGMPPLIGAVLVVLLLVFMTGALHEDGLADCADALGGSSAERRLEIMRDSQIGTYGALALIFSVAIRSYALFIFWGSDLLFEALLVSLMVSRGAMVLLPRLAEPARQDGLASEFKNISHNQLVAAQIIILVVGFIATGLDIVFMMIIGFIVALLMAKISVRKIGGFTGDVLGATEQITQIICLLIFLTFV